jgi:ferric-dicitrate binding protein FerR (iron transport regulator)
VSKLLDNLEEAARWFASERRGVMSLEERAALAAWRREPANAAALAELERVWALVQVARSKFGAEASAVSETRSRRFARSALVALVCIVSLGIGAISYSGNSSFWTKLDWLER